MPTQLDKNGAKTGAKSLYGNWPTYFLLPSFIIIAFITLFPFIYSVFLSFMQYNPVRPWYGMKFVGFRNFAEILTDETVWNSFKITILFVVGTVTIEFILGFAIALLFNRDIPGKKIFRSIILVPMILTPVVVGLLWKYTLNHNFGVIQIWTTRLGLDFEWHHAKKTALLTMIFVDVWEWTPFIFLIILAGLMAVPQEIVEMARMDGAQGLSLLFRILVPTIKKVILICIILRMVDAVRVFDTIWVLTRGGPSRATEVYTVHVFREGFQFMNIGYAAALSLVLLVVVLGLSILFIKVTKFEV
jgi:multiple sugar transport system permease protein